eukprot:SAG31_NODE_9441_length_1277_cov_1.134975_1_plen_277_part_01
MTEVQHSESNLNAVQKAALPAGSKRASHPIFCRGRPAKKMCCECRVDEELLGHMLQNGEFDEAAELLEVHVDSYRSSGTLEAPTAVRYARIFLYAAGVATIARTRAATVERQLGIATELLVEAKRHSPKRRDAYHFLAEVRLAQGAHAVASADDNGEPERIMREARAAAASEYEDAVAAGLWPCMWQRPASYVDGEGGRQPWYDPYEFAFAHELEALWPTFAAEAAALIKADQQRDVGWRHPADRLLYGTLRRGGWSEITLHDNFFASNCPATVGAL